MSKEISKTRTGRTGIGENRGSERRKSFSNRAMKGNLEVIKKICPHCGHHKAFKTIVGIPKCSKCKMQYELK